jgi:hypothetical protein
MLDTGHNEPHGRSDEDQVLGRTRSSRSGRTYARAVTRLRLSRMKPWIPSATAPHRNRQTPLDGAESSALSGRSPDTRLGRGLPTLRPAASNRRPSGYARGPCLLAEPRAHSCSDRRRNAMIGYCVLANMGSLGCL